MRIIFSISGKILSIVCPAYSFSLRATSGRAECLNNGILACQQASFKGPIPVGRYFIRPEELTDPGFVGDTLRNFRPDSPGDWGDWRVPIHPRPGTKTWGRDRFFLHGGRIEGSAGCIDIGGGLTGNQNTHRLRDLIKAVPISIDLEVIP